MTFMISQPMTGKTDEEIFKKRESITKQLESKGHMVADTYIHDDPPSDVKHVGLWYLAKSIEAMSKVDAVYFAENWFYYRGCGFEHICATAYDLQIEIENFQQWR